jgi:hypothetical protein
MSMQELVARVAQLELEVEQLGRIAESPPRRLDLRRARIGLSRQRRAVTAAALAVGVTLVPMIALGNHNFGDVPESNIFHTSIERVFDARIAAGCGGPNYCPGANVTREQMAAFLARTGGRVGYSKGSTTLSEEEQDLASVTITAGDVPGGTGFAQVDVTVHAYITNTTGCPCGVAYTIRQDPPGPGGLAGPHAFHIPNALTSGFSFASGALNWVVPVNTNSPATFRLVAEREGGTGTVMGKGAITVAYFPFSEDGDDVLGSAETP